MNTWYAPVYLAGIQTAVLVIALFQAYKDRRMTEKETMVVLSLIFWSTLMFIAVLVLFNLTLQLPELTIDMKRIDAVWY